MRLDPSVCRVGFSSVGDRRPLGSVTARAELGAWQGCASCQEIDALVYELYGLAEEEIAIVEGRDH